MTREEAIREIETVKQCEVDARKQIQALDMALAALRPITREQVEKMRGEWTTDGVCSRCGFDAMYYKGVPVQVRTNYCPTCGSPMTDEAVETIMKRMEEMRND